MNEQKLKRIEDYVEEHDNVSMTALCNEFNISMSTLRRAVTVLCERGTIDRSDQVVRFITDNIQQKLSAR